MLNTTVLSVIRTFSDYEIKRFEEFLLSPYYNKKNAVVNLFKLIKKYDSAFNSPMLERKKLWNKLYRDKEFNYGVMKNLIYDLGKAADKFMELQNYESNDNLNKLTLLREQLNRNLKSAFEKSLKSYKHHLSGLKLDPDLFYYQYRAMTLEREFTSQVNDVNSAKNFEEEKEINYLSLFYLNECADVYTSFLINSSYMHKDFNRENLKSFMNFIDEYSGTHTEITDCSFLSMKILLDNSQSQAYEALKNTFIENSYKFSSQFNKNIIVILSEYCNRNIMKGRKEFIEELFKISLFALEKDLMCNDKYINPFIFMQIVSAACNLNKFDWAENFISENKGKINPGLRDRFYNFANVTLNIKMKKFDQAMAYLSKVDQKSQMDYIVIKRYQLMIYYESNFHDELYSLIDAFKNFISKNFKLTESVKLPAGKFVYFIKKLSDIRFSNKNYDKADFAKLNEEIINAEVINKLWLIEKIEELKEVKYKS